MTTYRVKSIGDQQLLDRADAAYKQASLEYGNVPTMESLTTALMAAWDFITDITEECE